MTRRIVILRHGTAASSAERDRDRPLTAAGEHDIQQQAALASGLGLRFEAILASPYLRTQRTAELMLSAASTEHVETEPDLAPGAGPEAIQAIMTRLPGPGPVLIVGHQPDVGGMVGHLITGQWRPVCEMRPGTLVHLEFHGAFRAGAGILRHVLPPGLAARESLS